MVTPSVGEVILLPFPFSDLTDAKVRPAVCLASAGRGDWILCQITSNPYGDPMAQPIEDSDFERGGLRIESVARPGKLFTGNESLMTRSVGRLNAAARERLIVAVVSLFQSNDPES